MKERISILRHHVGVCLEPFLKNAKVSEVKEIIQREIFSRLENFEIEGVPIYQFLSDLKLKERFLDAFTKAGVAYVNNNYRTIPDEDSTGKQNADIICFGCGNFQENK